MAQPHALLSYAHRPPSLACCSATAAIWRPLPTLQAERADRGKRQHW